MSYQKDTSNLWDFSDPCTSRSISPENISGGKGCGGKEEITADEFETHPARELGVGWKVRPYYWIEPGQTLTLATIEGQGLIRHIWMANVSQASYRNLILRMYWDGSETPQVECPYGDFFFNGWDRFFHVDSAAVCVNHARAFNSFWSMPFRKQAKITLENRGRERDAIYYQIDYHLCELPEKTGYFHAHFRRTNPLPYMQDYVVLDTVRGRGAYVGTYLAYGANNNGWWGEGEFKFFMDGDGPYPTICGTGTEDYFLASHNFEDWSTKKYAEFTTQYAGFHALKTDNVYISQQRFGMYRLHIKDAICFEKDLRVTLQSLGWRSEGRFHPQQDDIASVAFYYLDHPSELPAPLAGRDELEII